jgi:hypothetical protein
MLKIPSITHFSDSSHNTFVSARFPMSNADRAKHNGFTGAGLAGDHIQVTRRVHLQVTDQCVIFYGEMLEHQVNGIEIDFCDFDEMPKCHIFLSHVFNGDSSRRQHIGYFSDDYTVVFQVQYASFLLIEIH